MKMFKSKEDLVSTLDKYDQLIYKCVSGTINFKEFLDKYGSFYMVYALDGHESNAEEQKLFESLESRIAPHREIWEQIISRICSDEDAAKESYIQAGRFGSDEALKRLKEINEKYFGRSSQ
jgi:hypothetical protein